MKRVLIINSTSQVRNRFQDFSGRMSKCIPCHLFHMILMKSKSMKLTQALSVTFLRAFGRNSHENSIRSRDSAGGYSCLNNKRLFSKQFKYVEIPSISKAWDLH